MKFRNYPVGTQILRTNGYIHVKTAPGSWNTLHRLNAMKKLGRDLVPGEKVYHIDGREDNSPENLVAIKFSLTKYVFPGKTSKILFMPNGTGAATRRGRGSSKMGESSG